MFEQVLLWPFPFNLSLLQIISHVCFAGFSYTGRADSYQTSSWSLGEEYIKEYNKWFVELQTQFLLGRYYKWTDMQISDK